MIDATAYIATFHCVPNYGAVLQTYGLQEYLKTIFKDVRVLDYRPDSLLHEYRNISWYSLGSLALSLWSLIPFLKKKKAFALFEKRLALSPIASGNADSFRNLKCDYFFVGSDQIWNPSITRGFDPVYFGCCSMFCRPKIISYAASLGRNSFSSDECIKLKQLLDNVDCISVREKDAQSFLSLNLGLKSAVVADPTILAGTDVFMRLVNKVQYEHYLFVYTLTNNPSTLKVAQQVAQEKGLQIIQVNGNRKPLRKPEHIIINDAGPVQFLSLLCHADFVVTDSFHGTVFSNLFHVPFITIPHKTRGGRMVTLLSELGLIDRLSNNSAPIHKEIDWNAVENHIKRLRQESVEFINQSL